MIDLHLHSRYSDDGEFSPAELVARCAAHGVTAMSVTDHNCARANAEVRPLAEACGIRYLDGIEIDCVFQSLEFHVLGYGIDAQSPDFAAIEAEIKRQSIAVSLERLEKTRALGFDITADELRAVSANAYWRDYWGGERFAEVLLARPDYADHPLLRPYRPGGEKGANPGVSIYWDYYAQGKPCYAAMTYPPMERILDIIHRNHGKAILAHPCVQLDAASPLLDAIFDLGADGAEAFSSYHSPAQAAEIYRRTRTRGLLPTCGSDYHGKTKPSVHLTAYGNLPNDFSPEDLLEALTL